MATMAQGGLGFFADASIGDDVNGFYLKLDGIHYVKVFEVPFGPPTVLLTILSVYLLLWPQWKTK